MSSKYVSEVSLTAFAVIGCALCVVGAIWLSPEPYQRQVNEGYNVGISGHPAECCPYTQDEWRRRTWMKGWMQGADELKAAAMTKK